MPAHPRNLTLAEYSDRELLHVLSDVADNNGKATAEEIAEKLGMRNEHPTRCVGARLAWLKRYGAVRRDDDGMWSMTSIGERFAMGALSAAEARVLDQIGTDKLLPMMSAMTRRYRRMAPTGAHLVRREWVHGTHQGR